MMVLSVIVGVQLLAIVLLVLDHFTLRRNLWNIGVAITPLLQLYEQRNQSRGCDHAANVCMSRGTKGHLPPLRPQGPPNRQLREDDTPCSVCGSGPGPRHVRTDHEYTR